MNGDVWMTKAGRIGVEISRQGAEVVSVELLFPSPDGMDWRSDVEVHPLGSLELQPNEKTRYGGDRGGRA